MSKLIYVLSQNYEAFFEAISGLEDMDIKVKTVIVFGTLFILGAEFSTKIEMLVDLCAGLIKNQLRTSQSLKIMNDLPRNIPFIFIEYLIRKDKHQHLRNIVSKFDGQIGNQISNVNPSCFTTPEESLELQFAIAYLVLQYEKKRKNQNSYQLVFESCISELASFGMSEDQKRSKIPLIKA